MAEIIEQQAPKTGDMYRCEQCQLEIHVTKGCECDPGTTKFECCGAGMKKVTELDVLNP